MFNVSENYQVIFMEEQTSWTPPKKLTIDPIIYGRRALHLIFSSKKRRREERLRRLFLEIFGSDLDG